MVLGYQRECIGVSHNQCVGIRQLLIMYICECVRIQPDQCIGISIGHHMVNGVHVNGLEFHVINVLVPNNALEFEFI